MFSARKSPRNSSARSKNFIYQRVRSPRCQLPGSRGPLGIDTRPESTFRKSVENQRDSRRVLSDREPGFSRHPQPLDKDGCTLAGSGQQLSGGHPPRLLVDWTGDSGQLRPFSPSTDRLAFGKPMRCPRPAIRTYSHSGTMGTCSISISGQSKPRCAATRRRTSTRSFSRDVETAPFWRIVTSRFITVIRP